MRVRLTVRRMMLAVAVLAIFSALAAIVLKSSRQREMYGRAYWHKDQAFKLWLYYLEPIQRSIGGEGLDSIQGDSPDLSDSAVWKGVLRRCPPADRALLDLATRRHIYHKRMQAKWDRAQRYLLRPVPPDPPFPPSVLDPLPNVWPTPSQWTRTSY